MTTTDLIAQGKALALAIHALQALDDAGVDMGSIDREIRRQLIQNYQRRLRDILITVTREQAAEIMAVTLGMKGPVGEVGVN